MRECVYWRASDGVRTALVVERGRKWIHLIPMEDHKVRIRKVPLSEERNLTPVLYHGKPYPWNRAVKHFKKHAGRGYGITKSAKAYLKPRRKESTTPQN